LLLCLPQSGGDDCGIGGAVRLPFLLRRVRRGWRSLKQFVEPLGVDFSAKKFRLGKNAAEKASVGLDACDSVLLEGSA
jgi:hypothetical protein